MRTLFLSTLLLASAAPALAQDAPPNIIFMLSDDQAWNGLVRPSLPWLVLAQPGLA